MTLGEQKNMKWKLAVLKVLQEANKPLHYQEILRAIKERQLRPITGKTPERTVYVNLLDLQDGGQVKRTDPGVFDIVLHSDNDEESPPAEEERPESPRLLGSLTAAIGGSTASIGARARKREGCSGSCGVRIRYPTPFATSPMIPGCTCYTIRMPQWGSCTWV